MGYIKKDLDLSYNFNEVAGFLKVTPTTVRRWTDSGELKCYRIGNKKERRFAKEDVIEYLHKEK